MAKKYKCHICRINAMDYEFETDVASAEEILRAYHPIDDRCEIALVWPVDEKVRRSGATSRAKWSELEERYKKEAASNG